MHTLELSLDTTGRPFTDLTGEARSFCSSVGGDGLLNVFAPHATAGIALFELGGSADGSLRKTAAPLACRLLAGAPDAGISRARVTDGPYSPERSEAQPN